MEKTALYHETKDVKEITDVKEAALLLQDEKWVAINAYFHEGTPTFIMIRID